MNLENTIKKLWMWDFYLSCLVLGGGIHPQFPTLLEWRDFVNSTVDKV